jgi:O-antigen biosynthesis protein
MKKKRVCILYHTSFGRNDGPPLFWMHNLKQREDLEVMHLVPDGDISEFGKFDYTFWVDYGEDGLPVDHTWKIPKSGGKTIYIASDTHIDEGYRLKRARDFDYVFFNQKRALQEFEGTPDTKYAGWLSHAADETCYKKSEILKKYDVCFIGHLQDVKNYNDMTRVEALDRLFKEFPEFYYGTRNPAFPEINIFEDAALKFCQSKIVFNISIKDDINMRVFETMATGSFLLTNWVPTLHDLFVPGEDLVTYTNYDEMIKKAHYYLEHEDERIKIAESGYNKVIKYHTYKKRIETVLDIVK